MDANHARLERAACSSSELNQGTRERRLTAGLDTVDRDPAPVARLEAAQYRPKARNRPGVRRQYQRRDLDER